MMKGVFFKKPLEFVLEIDGEKWHQGDIIKGTLVVKNHDTDKIDLDHHGVFLAFGNAKKVKSKDAKAFNLESRKYFGEKVFVEGGGELKLDFEFQLSEDCGISENSASFYLICGSQSNLHEVGHLRLEIVPAIHLSNFLEVLLDGFRFKVKTCRNKKGSIEATMVVPEQKDFSSLSSFKIQMNMDGDNINLKHLFKIKKFSFENSVQEIKDEELEMEQVLTPEDYLIYGKAINRAGISKRFEEILDKVRLKPLI